MLVGARADDTNGLNVGQAHQFDAVTGNLLQTFDDPTITDQDYFGSSVAIDGNRVFLGAPSGVGQAHLFDANTRIAGDFNGDGLVENDDLNLLLANWGQASVSPGWLTPVELPVENGEPNDLLQNWGFGLPAGQLPAIPEPASIALLLAGMLGMTRRR